MVPAWAIIPSRDIITALETDKLGCSLGDFCLQERLGLKTDLAPENCLLGGLPRGLLEGLLEAELFASTLVAYRFSMAAIACAEASLIHWYRNPRGWLLEVSPDPCFIVTSTHMNMAPRSVQHVICTIQKGHACHVL